MTRATGPGRKKTPYPGLYAWGALPLALGAVVFLRWFLTRGIGAALLGLLVVLLGLLATAGLAVHLGILRRRRRRTGAGPGRRTVLLALLLMLANYPAAAGCIAAYEFLATRAYLRIGNQSGAPLDEVTIHGPGGERRLGALADRATRRAFFRPAGDGPLALAVVQGATGARHTLTGYLVTEAGQAAWAVTARPGPRLESRPLFRQEN